MFCPITEGFKLALHDGLREQSGTVSANTKRQRGAEYTAGLAVQPLPIHLDDTHAR